MSAVELKFEGSFEKSNYLKDFECANCDKFITDLDISENNYRLFLMDKLKHQTTAEGRASR